MKNGEKGNFSYHENEAGEIQRRMGEITTQVMGLSDRINALLKQGKTEGSPEVVALDAEIELLSNERLLLSTKFREHLVLGEATKEIIEDTNPKTGADGKINKELIN